MNVVCVLVFAAMGHAAHYTQQWAVAIDGGPEVAEDIAQKHGFVNLGVILNNWYLFVHNGVAKRAANPSNHHHRRLLEEEKVTWAQQQVARSRKKRDFLTSRPRSVRTTPVNLNDPRWPQMWYLNRGQGLDMNVQPAWQQGVSGRGVVVTILDDGLEKDHPDLFRNYDPQASYDVNNHDEDPMPRYDLIDSNRHGTRCAGEVAAAANNSICAVGVAFGASVGGVRMLDGDVTDAVEARSLSLNPQHIDIYSASWGPDDDGKTVDGPGELATRAFIEGVTKGRNGKGSIFVWASGNGGRDHDNCNCDGYTNSIWTLSISSATENGYVPWYSEACSSTLATTYSSGSSGEKQVMTTDLHHQCTSSHTGTSASAPLAAGICALALESNRGLTWRDMQHIVVRTAKPANLKSSDWKVNGVGRNVSHSFGYGLMDASAMVRLARTWKTVPEQHKCEVSAPHSDKLIPAKSQVMLQLHVRDCAGVNFLEHVQAKISLASSRRGDLQIHLTSPVGTRTTLLARRPHDISRAGFQNWPFMSVHTWGEKPFGIWTLEIHNEGRFLGRATLQEWALIFYGTADTPDGNDIPRGPAPPSHSISSTSLPVTRPPRPSKSRPAPGHFNPPYVVNMSPPRKNKNTNRPHKNNAAKSAVRPTVFPSTPRPSVIEIRRPTVPTVAQAHGKSTIFNTTPFTSVPTSPTTVPTTRMITTTLTSTTTPMISESTTTMGSELTILLEPPSHPPPKLPASFQKYPKIQQLYPLYPLSKMEGIINSNKGRGDPSSFHPAVKMVPNKGLDLLQNEQSDSRHRQGSAKGTLLEWKLVFYGTDVAPGSDLVSDTEDGDQVDGGLSMDTNSAVEKEEEDDERDEEVKEKKKPTTIGEEWTDEKSVENDIMHNDVLRTTTENDASHAGCIALSKKGQDCIECVEGMILFNGRCVPTCPEQTVVGLDAKAHTACVRCHYSCKECSGPNDYQCVACYGDAFLSHPSSSESYCYPSTLRSTLESHKWQIVIVIVFLINILLLTFAIVYYFFVKKRGCFSHSYRYSKMSNGENFAIPTSLLDEKHKVIYDVSGSDSEN